MQSGRLQQVFPWYRFHNNLLEDHLLTRTTFPAFKGGFVDQAYSDYIAERSNNADWDMELADLITHGQKLSCLMIMEAEEYVKLYPIYQ